MPREMGFGVVGLGMGIHHCKAIQGAKGAQLVAVCDIDEQRLNDAVKEFGCKGYTKYSDMLKDAEVEAVNICTESARHAQMGVQAARAGKHIVMEKPVDITPQRIQKLQDAVKEAGIKCGCIFQARMLPLNRKIKEAIDKGKIGRLIGAHGCLPWYRAQSYFEGPHGPWRGTWSMDGGGSLMNQGIHDVDQMVWLAGRVKSVCGFFGVFNHKIEAEDQAVAILKFENGALGTFFTTTCANPEGARRFFFYGTKGTFVKAGDKLESYDMGTPKERETMMRVFGGKAGADDASRDPMAVSADGHLLIVEDLVKAVRSDREPVITLESARHSVEVACAIYKSGRTGKEVKISDVAH